MARTAEASFLVDRTEERAALAEAISHAADLKRAVAAAHAAVARADVAVRDAEGRLDSARSELATNRAARIAAALETGLAAEAGPSSRAARLEEMEAVESVDVAREVLAAAESRIAAVEYEARHATRLVEAARGAVVASALPALWRQTLEARETYARLAIALRDVADASRDAIPIEQRNTAFLFASNVKVHLNLRRQDDETAYDGERIFAGPSSPWVQAAEALLTDPDASLPAVT